jgi:TM2 domain-containing membrane protein YozV
MAIKKKDLGTSYGLWAMGFIGLHGIHRFYMGKIGTGILWLFTGGLIGLGWIYDAITMSKQIREINHRLIGEAAIYGTLPYGSSDQTIYKAPSKPESKEKIVIKLAYKLDGRVTVSDVVANSDLSLDEAEKTLKELASKGYAGMHVTDSGLIVYEFEEVKGRSSI